MVICALWPVPSRLNTENVCVSQNSKTRCILCFVHQDLSDRERVKKYLVAKNKLSHFCFWDQTGYCRKLEEKWGNPWKTAMLCWINFSRANFNPYYSLWLVLKKSKIFRKKTWQKILLRVPLSRKLLGIQNFYIFSYFDLGNRTNSLI